MGLYMQVVRSQIRKDQHAYGEISVSNYKKIACNDQSENTKISVGVEESIHTAANRFPDPWIVAAYWSCLQHAGTKCCMWVFDYFQ